MSTEIHLRKLLSERLVCRIRDEKIQQRLLVEKELTLQKAYEIATLMAITSKKHGRASAIERGGGGQKGNLTGGWSNGWKETGGQTKHATQILLF